MPPAAAAALAPNAGGPLHACPCRLQPGPVDAPNIALLADSGPE